MSVTRQSFKTKLIKGDGDTAGFVIPDKVVEAFGQGKKPKVTVTLNGGFSYPNTVAVMGGQFMIGVSKERRKLAGVTPGETMEVTLELDAAPRVMEVPADLQKALDKDKAAKAYFATLSYSNQRRHIDPINEAKAEETRARRIAKSVALFHEGKN
ncbi:MAG TPA: YdeI/OmpD-associated family protein [Devosia sp.]|nr:YdeI/OmpD-associated family protein [Devosia sp.]